MELLERFLIVFTRLLDLVSFSPYQHDSLLEHQVPLATLELHRAISQDAGPVFTPPGYDGSDNFTCDYSAMQGWTQCWTPDDLSCWLTSPDGTRNLSIYTNYEDVSITPTGIQRNYTFNVTAPREGYDADGLNFPFPFAKLINEEFPGPWVRACWGDTIHVTVNVDPSFYQGVALHAHGLRQWKKMHMDGVPGITQCPIPPGSSFEYVWPTTQYGSSWYHSHYSLQYPDGIQGPITIHGPSSGNYDVAPAQPLILTDWGK